MKILRARVERSSFLTAVQIPGKNEEKTEPRGWPLAKTLTQKSSSAFDVSESSEPELVSSLENFRKIS